MDLDDLYRLLRGAHVQAQGVIDTVRDPLLVLDADLCVVSANCSFYEVFGVDREATIGKPLYELGNGQWDIEELRLLLEKVIPRSAAVTDYEVGADFPHIGRRTMLISARRLVRPDRTPRTLLLSMVDATERRKKEQESQVFIGELQHRMKNLLGLVHALARQTEASHQAARQYRDTLLGRLNALSRSLEASMAGEAARLCELAARTLEPYAGERSALVLDGGPEVVLKPTQALPIGMILHELATNAMKHGALSADRGCVRASWEVNEGSAGEACVVLRWEESGGPAISPPETRGFGTRLSEFAAAQELGGTAELTFAPEGLRLEVRSPL